MKCMICKHGLLENGFSTITLGKDTSTIVFKHVPSLVCDNCGEKYVDDAITSNLLIKANEIMKSGVVVEVREYQQEAA